MHIPSRIKWLAGLIFLGASVYLAQLYPINQHPVPTEISPESGGSASERKAWFERMHRTAPGTNWRQLEYENQFRKQQLRQLTGQARTDCSSPVTLPGTTINGRWIERGSNNQAGSVFETAYDPEQDEIWLVSAGGSLWKSPRLKPSWELINQTIQLDPEFLKILPLSDENRRLVAFSNQLPYYSDDGGINWRRATGIKTEGDLPDLHKPVLMDNQQIFFLHKPDFYSIFEIYRSADQGQSYQKIMDLDVHDPSFFSLCRPTHTNTLILARKTAENRLRLQEWNAGQEVFVDIEIEQPLSMGRAPANLIGGLDSLGNLQLFTYLELQSEYFLYKSTDGGKSWQKMSRLPQPPWEVGLFLSPSNPDVLYMGEIEAFRSDNGGRDWNRINEWWEYYDDIENALHADIMAIAEYRTADDEVFSLISHHGGISISYDQFETQQNISLTGLNTSQYYSVLTDPADPNFVFAGSQDQGLQRAVSFENGQGGTEAFEQVLSGDYGPIVLTREGTALWTVYPDGWINYYDDPRKGYVKASFEVVSEDESVWLPPIIADPGSNKNGLLLAGGNIDGGPGSFLIQLEYRDKKIQSRQFEHDFKLESAGGALSALATAKTDPAFWYASTTNGRFFYSEDAGKSWEQSLNFIPEGHYLYGQAIHVSKSNPQRIILAGSGYNNPAVYLSEDGGRSFQAMNKGLPPTLVFSLAANADESMIFAATESGPYVYLSEEGKWFDMGTDCSPAQTYWAVEYIESIQTVRFGTYGRGIWDFKLETDTPVPEPPIPDRSIVLYPNPSVGPLHISTREIPENLQLVIRDAGGNIIQKIDSLNAFDTLDLNLGDLPAGIYFFTFTSGAQRSTRKLILNR